MHYVSVPVALNKLSDVIKNVVIKNIEDKIPDITNVATNSTFKAEIRLRTKY